MLEVTRLEVTRLEVILSKVEPVDWASLMTFTRCCRMTSVGLGWPSRCTIQGNVSATVGIVADHVVNSKVTNTIWLSFTTISVFQLGMGKGRVQKKLGTIQHANDQNLGTI